MVADQIEVSGTVFVSICLKVHDGSPPQWHPDSIRNCRNSSHGRRSGSMRGCGAGLRSRVSPLGTDLKFGPRLFGLTGGRLLLIFPIGLTLGRGRYRLDKFGGPALFALSLKLQWNGDAHKQLLAFSFG